MQPEPTGRIDRSLAYLLLFWALALHGSNFVSAGALWRDEANSIQQARLPSWASLWHSLGYDSFPALFPAALRLWSAGPWTASDAGLRVFGLLIGLILLASIFLVGRLLGTRWPIVVLVLVAANAVFISEGDSIRPYGLSLLFLLWAFGFMGNYLARPSSAGLALTTLVSVLSVQASYTNALSVGVFCLCAAGVAAARGERRRLWCFFFPGCIAALSLTFYAGTLERAREWAVILNSRVDWLPFLKRMIQEHSRLLPTVWLGFLALILCRLVAAARNPKGDSSLGSLLSSYKLSVLVLSLAVQILFMEVTGIPPFPRYFLPLAVFAAFAFEATLEGWKPHLRAAAVAAALLLSAWPAWSWMRMRHTNVDGVARALTQHAAPQDLIVVSPWFLNTGFQRYYRGPCEWITVPDLDHQPMMRYDLIKRAMLEHQQGSSVAPRLRSTLERGGAIWFVSQRPWSNFARAEAPDVPGSSPAPGGSDYIRFRSYWERDIEYRLQACCVPAELPDERTGPIWDEENLILTRWQEKQH